MARNLSKSCLITLNVATESSLGVREGNTREACYWITPQAPLQPQQHRRIQYHSFECRFLSKNPSTCTVGGWKRNTFSRCVRLLSGANTTAVPQPATSEKSAHSSMVTGRTSTVIPIESATSCNILLVMDGKTEAFSGATEFTVVVITVRE
jgi:hypothetical protein